jgi:hypothetical protein
VLESSKPIPDGQEWTEVLLKDATNLGAINLRVHIPPSDGDPVVVEFENRQYATQIDRAILDSARLNCAVLGQ